MEFHTKIPLQKQAFNQIDYHSKIFLLGSCFSENIAEKFSYFKFQSLVNPFGILFHPKAIETFINNVINEKEYTEADLFYHNELWQSFETHSRLSYHSKEELLVTLNGLVKESYQFLREASHVVLTFGTSWIYRFIETDSFVANCHKLPQKNFLKELFSVDHLQESLEAIDALIRSINPEVVIINTVSPVRHIKDGFVENTQSKSHIIAAIHQIVNANKHQYYFPSFEIMMDELRDYRFYTADMLHPNDVAIHHIWERFKLVWISDNAHLILDEIDAIQKGIAHKAFHPESDAHQMFLKQLNDKKTQIESRFPHINF
ncbi:GSCFA domain-containing protein [Psychroserpens sp.]|uniref:GSCFA domain-containing protein n=1 Tax=Psychroserpens sp. TaxID=2020870 RepID=UPI001B135BC3|nr:GSCFA domain-containing protein [Psychroserpens sp.]MBO6606015.1 GSCFA domain-containing protein [Psychroserpens sp.]MBO6632029.1 GSCFA domain-containing protein [Psychroserpens sp.]MBO6652614.1 GSCFA domain-containing protein [Psychroserpens sp.]MBO6681614.1 GSCFA domain-containing protein [Psychroserpens sp.]MBO6749389.1 GSCFA domain-containing protein [Psychroserpens sp.]